MIIAAIVCFIICAFFLCITFIFPQKVGNVLNILGIILSEVIALNYLSYGMMGKISGWIFFAVFLLIAVIFCFMLDVVNKKETTFLEQNGIPKKVRRKNKYIAALFAIILGSIGAHKFYLGKKTQGALYAMFFFTLIPGLIGLIEGIRYLTMTDEIFNWKYNPDYTNTITDGDGLIISDNEENAFQNEINMTENTNDSEIQEDTNDSVSNENIEDPYDSSETENDDFIPISITIDKIGAAIVEKCGDDLYCISIENKNGKKFQFKCSTSGIEEYKKAGMSNFKKCQGDQL